MEFSTLHNFIRLKSEAQKNPARGALSKSEISLLKKILIFSRLHNFTRLESGIKYRYISKEYLVEYERRAPPAHVTAMSKIASTE